MSSAKTALLYFLLILAVCVATIYLFSRFEPIISEPWKLWLSFWTSLLGYPLSVASAVFSGLAVYEVKKLVKRYVDRLRIPQLQTEIVKDIRKFVDLAGAPVHELHRSGVLSRFMANLRSIETHSSVPEIKKSAKECRIATVRYRKESHKTTSTVNQSASIKGYWELYGAFEELSTEITNYRHSERHIRDVQ